MKIIALQAENVKRISAVEIRPNGNLVEITGKNGAGKTSILDAIWWALAGASHIQSAPIRKGANEARIRLDLGEIRVTRTFRRGAKAGDKDATSIVVESADGARFPSPQRMLDALIGALSFDPLAFARDEPKAQFDLLKAFVPGVDFAAIERAQRGDFERRTDVNREAKQKRDAAAQIVLPADAPTERRDEAALVAELERAGQHNADLEKRKANRQAASEKIERLTAERQALADGQPARLAAIEKRRAETVDDLERQIEALRQRIVGINAAADDDVTNLHDQIADERRALETEAHELQKKLDAAPPLPELIDTAALREQITSARDHNELVAKRQERDRLTKQAEDLEAQSQTLTDAMKARQADKLAKIAAAKLPIDGIEFGDNIILMNGVPFDQASDAEQLRASVAIAAALNPKLRVIRVRDGSLLDDASMALVADMAANMDMQVWVETVQSGRPGAVVIEDGMVKASVDADAEETEAAE